MSAPDTGGTGIADGSLVRIEDAELAKTIERARTRLLLEQPSLAAAVMRIPVVQIHSDQLPAGIGVARGAIVVSQALRLKEDPWISYAYAHNLIHLLFEHLERRGSRVRCLWDLSIDIATAAMIDPLLSPEVLNYVDYDPRPKHSTTFQSLVTQLGSLSCEQIYDHLSTQIIGRSPSGQSATRSSNTRSGNPRQTSPRQPNAQSGHPASGDASAGTPAAGATGAEVQTTTNQSTTNQTTTHQTASDQPCADTSNGAQCAEDNGGRSQSHSNLSSPPAAASGIPEDGDPIAMYVRALSSKPGARASSASSPNPEFEGDPQKSGHAHDIKFALGADVECSDLDRALVIQEIAEALNSSGKLAGTEAGRWSEMARRARTREVPWERVFAERLSGLVPTDFQTFPFSKRHLWRGVYLPSIARKGIGRILFAIDTSGSMGIQVLGQVADQIDQLRQATACSLTIAHFDTEIQKISKYDEFQDPIARGVLEMPGRGGTDLRVPFHYVTEQMRRGESFAGLVIATDGCGPLPEEQPSLPVIWLVPDADFRGFKPPFGTMIACGQGGSRAH